MMMTYTLTADMRWQQQTVWQTSDTPFMSFAFWQALADTDAIGESAGWLPLFVLVYRGHEDSDNMQSAAPIAVMPVFIKGHHHGEFVFDYGWAEAYARYGLDYYPRLVTSVPYTPITGERLWLAKGEVLTKDIIAAALAGVDDIAKQVGASSWHGLFVTPMLAALSSELLPESEISADAMPSSATLAAIAAKPPILERQGCQFLWQNQNLMQGGAPFADFEAFLATLTAKKRKTIRAERRKVAAQGIRCYRKCGLEISTADWEAFYQCYVMTYAIRGQQAYLSLDFFTQLAATMPEHLFLAQACDADGDIIASSLFLYDVPHSEKNGSSTEPTASTAAATLYGRYWGALGDYDSLHFELCYYQGIEFAIERDTYHTQLPLLRQRQ